MQRKKKQLPRPELEFQFSPVKCIRHINPVFASANPILFPNTSDSHLSKTWIKPQFDENIQKRNKKKIDKNNPNVKNTVSNKERIYSDNKTINNEDKIPTTKKLVKYKSLLFNETISNNIKDQQVITNENSDRNKSTYDPNNFLNIDNKIKNKSFNSNINNFDDSKIKKYFVCKKKINYLSKVPISTSPLSSANFLLSDSSHFSNLSPSVSTKISKSTKSSVEKNKVSKNNFNIPSDKKSVSLKEKKKSTLQPQIKQSIQLSQCTIANNKFQQENLTIEKDKNIKFSNINQNTQDSSVKKHKIKSYKNVDNFNCKNNKDKTYVNLSQSEKINNQQSSSDFSPCSFLSSHIFSSVDSFREKFFNQSGSYKNHIRRSIKPFQSSQKKNLFINLSKSENEYEEEDREESPCYSDTGLPNYRILVHDSPKLHYEFSLRQRQLIS